jgi:hypothetical protein
MRSLIQVRYREIALPPFKKQARDNALNERCVDYGHLLVVAGRYYTIDDREIEAMQ